MRKCLDTCDICLYLWGIQAAKQYVCVQFVLNLRTIWIFDYKRMEKTTRIDSLIILRTQRAIRYTPALAPTASLFWYRKRTHSPTRATTNTNFMMIPEVREFCFINFILSFLITSDIFFHASSVSFGRFLFKVQQIGIGFLKSIFFLLNTLDRKGKRKIWEKTARLEYVV